MSIFTLSLLVAVVYYAIVRNVFKKWLLVLLFVTLSFVPASYYMWTTVLDFHWLLSKVDYGNAFSLLIASPVLLSVVMMTLVVYVWSCIVLSFAYLLGKRMNNKKEKQ